MRKLYLALSILGFALPFLFVIEESFETGNYFLWVDPLHTFKVLFQNNISSAISMDLIAVGVVFIVWTIYESLKYKIRELPLVWLTALLMGLGGSIPLFL
jgi:ABC-type spermidine/putrescine transport system permease subunit II